MRVRGSLYDASLKRNIFFKSGKQNFVFIVECATTLSRVENGVSMTQRYQSVKRREVRRCHMLCMWENVTLSVVLHTQWKRFTKMELRSYLEKSGR